MGVFSDSMTHLRSSSRERKRMPLSGQRILPERMSSFASREVFIDTVSAQNRVRAHRPQSRAACSDLSISTREEQQKGLLLPVDVEVVTKQLNSAQSLSKIIHEQADAGYLGLIRLLGLRSSAHIRPEQHTSETACAAGRGTVVSHDACPASIPPGATRKC